MRAMRLFVAAIAAVGMFATSGLAYARDVRVALDQAFPIRLSKTIGTGNRFGNMINTSVRKPHNGNGIGRFQPCR